MDRTSVLDYLHFPLSTSPIYFVTLIIMDYLLKLFNPTKVCSTKRDTVGLLHVSTRPTPTLKFTRERLYALRRCPVALRHPSALTLSAIASLGLLHYRGSRGGKRFGRPISTMVKRNAHQCHRVSVDGVQHFGLLSTSVQPVAVQCRSLELTRPTVNSTPLMSPDIHPPLSQTNQAYFSPPSLGIPAGHSPQRPISVLVSNRQPATTPRAPVSTTRSNSTHTSQLIYPSINNSPHPHSTYRTLPRLFLLNSASLAKPHAIEALQTEVMSLDIDIAIITESHFKAHHSSGAVGLLGYTCYRRDRGERRGAE